MKRDNQAVRGDASLRVQSLNGSRPTIGREGARHKLVRKRLGARYPAHPLRVSSVTVAIRDGPSAKAIGSQTKHKADAMIARHTQPHDAVARNAAQAPGP